MRGFLIGLLFLSVPAAAENCGSAEVPCEVDGGSYHVLLPDGRATAGVVMHLHGAGATGKGALRGGLAREALKRGYAFIGPNGEHPEGRFKKNWSVRATGSSFKRDDISFLRSVLADAEARHGIDRERVLLSGFSRGGSMVWDIACFAPDLAAAFAPVAGAFWDALPQDCERPVDLFHTHGWDDRTVPLEGRSLGGGRVVQGDVWASLFILRAVNGCAARQPERSKIEEDRWWRYWTDCAEGSITLMLHPGGHGVPKGWSAEVLDWFEAITE